MPRQRLGFVALAAATAWNAGNVGPAAAAIAADLGVSLAAVGVLGGSAFFAGLVAAKLGAARLTRSAGAQHALRLTLGLAAAGNAALALSPCFAGAAAGRAAAGLSLGLALVLGPVLARNAGGVRMLGLFGGAVTVGTAAGLGAGSLLRALGLDWRLDFALAAAVALAALLVLPPVAEAEVSPGSVLALARRSAARLPAWRLEALFMTALGVPYVLGVWLVPYLTDEAGLSAGLAGALGVALFAIAALMRPEGSRLEADGSSLTLLGGVAPIVAAAGLVGVALADSAVLAAAGVALAGVGFAIPYAAMYDEAQKLFPEARVAAVGLFSVGANLLPLAVTPAIGAAIASGDGELAVLGLALISVLAGLANLRPAVAREAGTVSPRPPGATRS